MSFLFEIDPLNFWCFWDYLYYSIMMGGNLTTILIFILN